MALAFVPVFADDSSQMQIASGNNQAYFFRCLATGTRVWRFTDFGLELSSARTPESQIRFLCSLQQQDLVLLVKTIQQG